MHMLRFVRTDMPDMNVGMHTISACIYSHAIQEQKLHANKS
jgi:hypothetical protein